MEEPDGSTHLYCLCSTKSTQRGAAFIWRQTQAFTDTGQPSHHKTAFIHQRNQPLKHILATIYTGETLSADGQVNLILQKLDEITVLL